MSRNRKNEVDGIFEPEVPSQAVTNALIDYFQIAQDDRSRVEATACHSARILSAAKDDAWMRKNKKDQKQIEALFSSARQLTYRYSRLRDDLKKAIALAEHDTFASESDRPFMLHATDELAQLLKFERALFDHLDGVPEIQAGTGFTAIATAARCYDAFIDLKGRKPEVGESRNSDLFKLYTSVRSALATEGVKVGTPKQAMRKFMTHGSPYSDSAM
ncbi:MAG: hypothetical protein CSA72_09695 [Rhodobacterales bacterium]|nr:MAG: hypothetical protein CSA72_09695 [Rhodobacterales bacterium]